ncbi:hypothetical protein LIA77_02970 [Sarocladium implicatum]|nr:hypothetical protein LIA77_02970 [Sarocladium implicatum]
MQLQLFAVTAFSLLATARAAPEVTADALAKGINELAKVSNTTDMLLTPMTKDDVTDVMPEVIKNLQGIVGTGLENSQLLAEAKNATIPKADQPVVCDALANFTQTHEDLLDTLVEKKDLSAGTPYPAPLSGVLSSVEAVIDQLAVALIALLPSCKEDATAAQKTLATKFGNAIKAYAA